LLEKGLKTLIINFSAQNDPAYSNKPDDRPVVINYKLINSKNITIVNNSFPSFATKYGGMLSYSLNNIHDNSQLPPDIYTISFDVVPAVDILYKNISVIITTEPIDAIDGWVVGSDFEEGGPSNGVAEKCRQMAIDGNGKYVAWGHRNDNHPTPAYRNTCFLYKKVNALSTALGLSAMTVDGKGFHSTGCLIPGKNVSSGCL